MTASVGVGGGVVVAWACPRQPLMSPKSAHWSSMSLRPRRNNFSGVAPRATLSLATLKRIHKNSQRTWPPCSNTSPHRTEKARNDTDGVGGHFRSVVLQLVALLGMTGQSLSSGTLTDALENSFQVDRSRQPFAGGDAAPGLQVRRQRPKPLLTAPCATGALHRPDQRWIMHESQVCRIANPLPRGRMQIEVRGNFEKEPSLKCSDSTSSVSILTFIVIGTTSSRQRLSWC
jgi:hypothetical protein